MNVKLSILAVSIVTLSAVSAQACSREPDSVFNNNPVVYGANCSYTGAGEFDFGKGGAVTDLGKNRISQMIEGFSGTQLVVTDCKALESVVVVAQADDPVDECGPFTQTDKVVAPLGAFDPAAGRNLSDVVVAAKGMDLSVLIGTLALNAKQEKKDQVDFMCGCKTLYPYSLGAQQ